MKNSFLLLGGLRLRMLVLVATCALVCGSARADGIVSITSNVTVNQTTSSKMLFSAAVWRRTLGPSLQVQWLAAILSPLMP
jgi:hypothetical protein